MSPMTGRVIAGRYRLAEPIGRGAMGVVWRATDQLLDRDVAIKEVRFNEALGEVERSNAYKRTLREARTAARLRGGDARPASGRWSPGATIYAASEGRGPYEQRGGAITTMTAIINEDAPAAPSADRLQPVIAALLRRDPMRRPPAAVAASMI